MQWGVVISGGLNENVFSVNIRKDIDSRLKAPTITGNLNYIATLP